MSTIQATGANPGEWNRTTSMPSCHKVWSTTQWRYEHTQKTGVRSPDVRYV